MKFLFVPFILVSLYGTATATTHRQALVIGNDTYPGNALLNARNDANGIAQALSGMGYTVNLHQDVDLQTLSDSVSSFSNGLVPSDVVVIYYSGHGFQLDGENYLVPVDFNVSSPLGPKAQAYSLSSLIKAVQSRGVETVVVILDACRNNPFLSTRSPQGGWSAPATTQGNFIAFGTSPGSTASDSPMLPHGLFTNSLLKYIGNPDLDIDELFEKVREEVIRESNGMQIPWVATSLVGGLHLNPAYDGVQSHPPQTPASIDSRSGQIGALSPRSINNAREESDDASVPILIRQALLLAQQNNYDEAIRSLSSALAIQPQSSWALRILGLILHLVGRTGEAISALDRAIAADPTEATNYYDRCLVSSGIDALSAVRDCQAAVGMKPNFAQAHLVLANALLSAGQPAKAYDEAKQGILLAPNLPLGYSVLGKIATALGNYSEAQADFETAVRLSTAP